MEMPQPCETFSTFIKEHLTSCDHCRNEAMKALNGLPILSVVLGRENVNTIKSFVQNVKGDENGNIQNAREKNG